MDSAYVLDSYALLAHFEDEAGGAQAVPGQGEKENRGVNRRAGCSVQKILRIGQGPQGMTPVVIARRKKTVQSTDHLSRRQP